MRIVAKILAVSFAMMSVSAWACTRPPQGDYDWVGCLRDGVAISYQGVSHGLVDEQGRAIIHPKYREIRRLNDVLFAVSDGKRLGVIDRTDKVILPMAYDYILPQTSKTDTVYVIMQNHKHGLMDDKGNVLIELKDDHFRDEGGLIITKGNPMDEASRWFGVMDYQGNVIIPFEYGDIKSFADYFTANKNGKVLLLNHNNQVIDQFEDVKNYYPKDYLMVKRDGKWGVIDKNRQQIIPFMYDDIRGATEGLFPVAKNDKWGVVNNQNQVVVDFQYDSIHEFNDGLAATIKNGKYGYIDHTGKIVVDFRYDLAFGFYHGLAEVAVNNDDDTLLHGVIDKTGKTIVPLKYHHVSVYSEPNANEPINIGLNDKYGMVTRQGEPMIDLLYDEMFFFREGRAEVTKDGEGFYIDESGRQIGGSWLIHEQACRHVQVGQSFAIMLFSMLPVPLEVTAVDVKTGKATLYSPMTDETNEASCAEIPAE